MSISHKFFLVLLFIGTSKGGEQDVLKVLATSPVTGFRMPGISCWKAMQVAVDAANEKNHFLKGFKVEMIQADDGFGPLGVAAVGNFYRNYIESRHSNQTIYPAPIATGFLTTLNLQTVAPILPYINMAIVSMTAGAPSFANETRFRNMFRVTQGYESNIGPIAALLKSFKWDKIALLFLQTDNDVSGVGNEFMKVAPDHNITIVWSKNVEVIDETVVESLKQSKARVIFFTAPERHLTTMLMCQMYQRGFYNSNYIFLALTTTISKEEFMTPRVPGGCTKEELLTMYNIVLFVGSKPFVVNNLGNVSYLGYDFDDFNRKYDQLMATEKKEELNIHRCHDAMLETLIALHEGNEKLISTKNMTLRDYLAKPEEVFSYVRDALAQISFKGLRFERYFYSESGEFEDEPLVMVQWTDGERWKFPYDAVYDENTGKYSMENVSPIQWITKDGNPPKGWPNIVKTSNDIPLGFFIAVAVFAIVLTPIQGLVLIPSYQFLQFIGIFFLNLSSTLIAIPIISTDNWLPICYTRLVTLAVGLVISSILLLFESFSIWQLVRKRRGVPNSKHRSIIGRLLIAC